MAEKQPRKVKRVVKKQPARQGNIFTDTLQEAWSHMLTEVLIPGLRDSLYESGIGILSSLIYKDAPQARGAAVGRGQNPHRVNYNKPQTTRPRFSKRDQRNMRFENFTFDSYKEAKRVLDELYANLSQYGTITVSDFYDAAGYSNNDFTNDNWGWSSLLGSNVIATRHGFALNLPDPEPLN